MRGTIRFVPVKNGSEVDLGDTGLLGISGHHKYLGFKPGRASRQEGWLVVLMTDKKRRPRKPRK